MSDRVTRDDLARDSLLSTIDDVSEAFEHSLTARDGLVLQEVGVATQIGQGIARVSGLPTVQSEELVRFPDGLMGMAFTLSRNEVGVILLGEAENLSAGAEVRRTGRVIDVAVGDDLLGRVVNSLGEPLDGRGPVHSWLRRPIEREVPPIMDRAPVSTPLQTGLKAVDALIPIGRGQRELIVGDRQTGKTAVALDTIINQRDTNVICVYCAIGQRSDSTARVIADLRKHGAIDYTVVVVASGEDPPGLQYVAPYAATTMAEYFMGQGQDALVVYDDLGAHAKAYREVSLLLRRPPGREAYPGDIFFIHSRLLERATHLRPDLGGGSLTSLPIVATEAQNISAYIPTNLISITDGQIYLNPELFQKGILPAIDVGESVSRVGGKTQLPAYRAVAGDLRLQYTQFEELEQFARFGTRLDADTKQKLTRGQRVREALQQPQYEPIPVEEQIAVLLAASQGVFDEIGAEEVDRAAGRIRRAMTERLPEVCDQIRAGETLSDEDLEEIETVARRAVYLEMADEDEDTDGDN
ncbi:MAG: alternate F1F0 ATPase, F1 subunit alpha [Armatimonadia bacterium]|nr:alternate F1F0 ATPase, F1 subunit alpha [Armatimonadia bacterium]